MGSSKKWVMSTRWDWLVCPNPPPHPTIVKCPPACSWITLTQPTSQMNEDNSHWNCFLFLQMFSEPLVLWRLNGMWLKHGTKIRLLFYLSRSLLRIVDANHTATCTMSGYFIFLVTMLDVPYVLLAYANIISLPRPAFTIPPWKTHPRIPFK